MDRPRSKILYVPVFLSRINSCSARRSCRLIPVDTAYTVRSGTRALRRNPWQNIVTTAPLVLSRELSTSCTSPFDLSTNCTSHQASKLSSPSLILLQFYPNQTPAGAILSKRQFAKAPPCRFMFRASASDISQIVTNHHAFLTQSIPSHPQTLLLTSIPQKAHIYNRAKAPDDAG